MTVNTEIIVLNTTKVGDNSLVLHTLSREYGRRSFIVKGLGKKSVMSYFQPLNILEADIIESTKSNLFVAKNFVCRYPLAGTRGNLYKNTMTMFISEVLFRTVREGCREEGLFEMCESEILLLDAVQSDFSNFHLRFLLGLAVALGFSPTSSDLAPFVGQHLNTIEKFLTEPFEYTMLIPLSGSSRNEIAEGILRYLEFHTESTINIRSLSVLHDLFI